MKIIKVVKRLKLWHTPTPTLTYLLTYLLTPWCRALLEKLTGLQLIKKFPAFYGTRKFITSLTSVHHLSLSWASPIQSIYPHHTSWRSILILSRHLRLGLPVVSFPPVSPGRTYTPPSPHPYVPYAQPISFFSILSPAQYWVRSTNHLAPRYAMHTNTHTHKTATTGAWWCHQRCLVFRGGVAENSVLLGCDADLMGKGAPTFRGAVLRSKQRDVITH